MSVTATFRKAVLSYERPSLTWSKREDCTVKRGEEIVLLTRRSSTTGGRDQAESWRTGHDELMAGAEVLETPVVTITIGALLRTKTGGVRATYRVRDDRAEFMARGVAKDGRTTNRGRSIDPDAEMPERDFTDHLAKEAAARNSALQAHKRRQAEVMRAEARLNRNRRKRPRANRLGAA